MAVRRVNRAAAAVKVTAAPAARVKLALPKSRKKPLEELSSYSMLLYAPPKFGKSVIFSTFPDIMFLTTEPGTKDLEIFEFNAENGGVTSWPIMMEAVKLLEKSKRFKNVVIDIVDEAYAMCMDDVCRIAGVEHPHDAEDFGKTWNKVSREFITMLHRIVRTGRGLYMTSHVKERTIEPAQGQKFTRIGSTLTGKAETAILGFVDMIWYGEVMKGGRRLILTEGDDLVLAGSRRRGVNNTMPTAFLLPEDEREDYDHVAAIFSGEVEGADASELWTSRMASKAVDVVISSARTKIDKKQRGGADEQQPH